MWTRRSFTRVGSPIALLALYLRARARRAGLRAAAHNTKAAREATFGKEQPEYGPRGD